MADNFSFTAGSGLTGAADDIGGVLFPRVKLTQGADNTNDGDVSNTLPFPVRTAPKNQAATATMTRPNDTTAYAVGDLVANSTTAGSVTPYTIALARGNDWTGRITSCRFQKSGTTITNAIFRVHIFNSSPAVANGDNGAFTPSNVANWLGYMDVTVNQAASDGAFGYGISGIGSFINFTPSSGSTNLYALIEARAAYTPAAQEVFTLSLSAE